MRTPFRVCAATTLVPGQAEGSSFVLREPLSFWGGLDVFSGRIIDRWHPQHNDVISNQILVMTAGRGSSSGSSVLAEAIRLGTGPAGIVLLKRDPMVIVGAMVARELYDTPFPVVLAGEEDWPAIMTARRLTISADDAWGEIAVA
jgi:uncharacterized protein